MNRLLIVILGIKLILLSLLVVTVVKRAPSAELYPTVAQLQQALNAYPGARLPPQVMANGRVWTGYYVSAKELGGGRYVVTIELK